MDTKSINDINTQVETQQNVCDNRTNSGETARRLLSALFPERFNIQGSLGITSKSLGFSVGDEGWFSSTSVGAHEAACYAVELGADVYFHCSSQNPGEVEWCLSRPYKVCCPISILVGRYRPAGILQGEREKLPIPRYSNGRTGTVTTAPLHRHIQRQWNTCVLAI